MGEESNTPAPHYSDTPDGSQMQTDPGKQPLKMASTSGEETLLSVRNLRTEFELRRWVSGAPGSCVPWTE